jgi:hypothetical protein
VEAHLRQVFRKLGVRSRTELALRDLDAHGGAAVADRKRPGREDPADQSAGF